MLIVLNTQQAPSCRESAAWRARQRNPAEVAQSRIWAQARRTAPVGQRSGSHAQGIVPGGLWRPRVDSTYVCTNHHLLTIKFPLS
jgi:hypothetical protein